MEELKKIIAQAQTNLRECLEKTSQSGGLTKPRYCRFLTMQYYLTNGVQRHFFHIAGHSSTSKKRALRSWLVNFAQEEEFHFEIALSDLKNLNESLGECPIDVQLWWRYFDEIIKERPFLRLGATCILENISNNSSEVLDLMIKNSDFLDKKNLKFLTIHRHGPDLAHGEQILKILADSNLNAAELRDLEEGARIGSMFYLRFILWVIRGEAVAE